MRHIHRIMITAILASVAAAACATDQDQNLGDDGSAPQIRSTQDLESYLRTTPDSPLNRMSADARQRFLNSLVFTEKGLASFQYSELKTLPATDILQILSLFGLERTMSLFNKEPTTAPSNFTLILDDGGGSDHEGYWCSGRATCSTSINSICTSNC